MSDIRKNLENNARRADQRVPKPGFVETATAKAIFTLIRQTAAFSADEGCIGVVIGDSGHGKSFCLREYAIANKNCIYIPLDDTMTTKVIFSTIAESIGADPKGVTGKVCRRIWETLWDRDLVLLLDECSGLSIGDLNRLRQVIACKGRTPFVLSGNGELLKTLSQGRVQRGCESLDQFCSRLLCVVNLDEIAGDGGLYSVEEVRRLYEFGGIRLASDAVDVIKRICQAGGSGRLRTCSLIVRALHTIDFVQEKKVITAEYITACIAELGLPVGRILSSILTRTRCEKKSKIA